ncbi:response regulator [Candidatus Peribacteria bacterium]|jgi:two-component system, OmpR family, response regulator TctD|nr:response regulator [Candidatus Peribacteria bacterium]MBT4021047.1 response regulator [Candidatus Peribacteria bacterium]MBT4240768.1 response regulator [Candidatus Peribacteria bacterium]MBT4474203.1 response regulator [Candidatus Peribacteria bacterium]
MSDKKHILVVEDEKALSHALQIKLESEGYQVSISEDGKEASELIEQESFDLILLDVIMPRMDGFNFLMFLKGSGHTDTPVMVLSNLGQDEDIEKAKSLGATDYMVKANAPFAKIIESVKGILDK